MLIGAGSAMFTQGLLADIMSVPALGPWEVRLVDTDPDALETAYGLCRRMIAARGAAIAVRAAPDRRDVLADADVVVVTIGVGGRRAWETDVFVPRRHGIFQPVGDTVMPGGISRALRMVPALSAIARDVQALCPRALFVNYSNPMTVNCWAVRAATGLTMIGLCHGVYSVERELAGFIGAPAHEVTSWYAGVNHLTFFLDLHWRGRDAWPLVRARVARERGAAVDEASLAAFADEQPCPSAHFCVAENPFSWSLFDTYGAYPAVNDRHAVEFFPEQFPRGQYYGKTLGLDAFSFEDTIAQGDRIYAEMRAQARGEQALDARLMERGAGEHEQLVAIMKSIAYDERRIFSTNLPNEGAVPNLPADAVIELPAVACARGMVPLRMPALPDALAEVLTAKIAAARLTVEAALQCDRARLNDALLADGAVNQPEAARALAEELLHAQRPHLPEQWFTHLPGSIS